MQPRPEWAALILTLAGLGVSIYLTWLKWTGKGAAFCLSGSGCDIVQASRYAMFLGVPTALWGAVVYAAVGVLAVLGWTAVNRWLAAFILAASGAGFSIYLTYLSLFVVGGACVYCLASSVIVLALLAALVYRRPRGARHKAPIKPGRLATYGVLAGTVAVVFGAFVFAFPSSAPLGYQLALARHLKSTKAVMYGAFW